MREHCESSTSRSPGRWPAPGIPLRAALLATLLVVRVALPALAPAAAAAAAAGADAQEQEPVTTVGRVDLQRYAGLWYEIARIPNRFQSDCATGATAEYRLRDDGRLTVVNRCYREDGTLNEAEGVAKVVDAHTNAKLKVSFVSFLGWRPFWGDYWILGLDEAYQWVVVGTPGRKYGWVLARSPEMSASALTRAFAVLERNGYERDAFAMSEHE